MRRISKNSTTSSYVREAVIVTKQPKDCACETCQGYCQYRAGWPTPVEADKLLDLGLADKLWLDYWGGGFDDDEEDGYRDEIDIVAPAAVGYGGERAPFWPEGRCIFYTDGGMCSIHDSGAKPFECRMARHDHTPTLSAHEQVAQMWDTPEGKKVVSKWRSKINQMNG